MAKALVTDCQIDPERLLPIKECMETYDMEKDRPESEFPWNCISRRAVAYSCGAIGKKGDKLEHRHDPAELDLCRRLSAELHKIMENAEVGMGCAHGYPFYPLFITANQGAPAPEKITEKLIRSLFGDTICPPAQFWIEPLEENKKWKWWNDVLEDSSGKPRDYWRNMIQWFHNQKDLHGHCFVCIGEDPLEEYKSSDYNGGCVFPRMAVGLTNAGSLVGICGYTVHA